MSFHCCQLLFTILSLLIGDYLHLLFKCSGMLIYLHFILFSFSKLWVDFLFFSGILLCRIFFFNFSGINWLSYIFSIGIILFGPIWLRINWVVVFCECGWSGCHGCHLPVLCHFPVVDVKAHNAPITTTMPLCENICIYYACLRKQVGSNDE